MYKFDLKILVVNNLRDFNLFQNEMPHSPLRRLV